MLCIKMAQICGASEIIAVGASGDEERLKMALDYGATMALNSQKDDVESIIMSMGDGYGVDLVVDAAVYRRHLSYLWT